MHYSKYRQSTKYRTKNKYNATKQTYNGYSYHSKKEAEYAMELDILLKGKQIKEWKRQTKIELFGENGTRVCNYYMDFVITHNGKLEADGLIEYIEVKGFKTAVWNLKKKLMDDKVKEMKNCKYTVVYV